MFSSIGHQNLSRRHEVRETEGTSRPCRLQTLKRCKFHSPFTRILLLTHVLNKNTASKVIDNRVSYDVTPVEAGGRMTLQLYQFIGFTSFSRGFLFTHFRSIGRTPTEGSCSLGARLGVRLDVTNLYLDSLLFFSWKK